MNPLQVNLSALTGAWMTLGALSFAQASDGARTPPSRIPHPARTVPHASAAAADADGPATDRILGIPSTHERYSRLHWQTESDGTIWVRGRQYKASFGAEGATYYPLFGSRQPQHFPVRLSLESASSDGASIALGPVLGAMRSGDHVVIDRGPIDEVYELSVDGVEQTFVISERPAGKLLLDVKVESELPLREHADGFDLTHAMGSVRYSRAFVREPDGGRRPLSTRIAESGVSIEVDAAYLATAQFPLVVDPVISTFPVDVSTFNDVNPDVAYDAGTDRFLFVYEEIVTASDGDVYTQMFTSSGSFVSGGYLDNTLADWWEPSVANLRAYGQFMVAARVYNSPAGPVAGKQTSAATLSWGPLISIATTTTSEVVIGGDPYPSAPAFFCVAYNSSPNILARTVSNTGVVSGTPLTVSTVSGAGLSMSKGNGGDRWNIVWYRSTGSFQTDIHGAQVLWNGTSVVTPAFVVDTNPSYQINPRASSPLADGRYMVTWTRAIGGDYQIRGAFMDQSTRLATDSLTLLENLGGPTRYVYDSAVDTDGRMFSVAYSEILSVTRTDVYVSSFLATDTSLVPVEVHLPVASSTIGEYVGGIASTFSAGGTSRRHAIAMWQETDPTPSSDIFGTLYDTPLGGPITSYCFGDGSGATCPCGNNGTSGHGCASSVSPAGGVLAGTGTASLASDTVTLTASSLPGTAGSLFYQGTTQIGGGAGALFGDGLRCAGGSIVRLATKTASGGVASYPGVGDARVSIRGAVPAAGAVRYYQCWYRNSASFCTASTFNLTNGTKVVWLP